MARSLIWVCSVAAAAATTLSVPINLKTAEYEIVVDGSPWLTSAAYSATSGGESFTTANGGLVLSGANATNGVGPFGAYTGASLTWNVGSLAGHYVTNFYVYQAKRAVVFEQYFPFGLNGTALPGEGAPDELTAAFPTFGPEYSALDTDLAFLTYTDTTIHPNVGRWTNSSASASLFGRNCAMLALFNQSGTSVVLSSANDFMVSHPAFAPSIGHALGLGLGGAIDGIPAGHRHSSLLVVGPALNDTFVAWGDLLLQLGGKTRPPADADLHTAYLSYWMDNGAWYYYNTPGMDYEQTVLQIKAYLQQQALPVRSIQFDSWWYWKRNGDTALLLWEPVPSIFPDGMTPWPGMPLSLHNRWFADVNNYTANFTFLHEKGATMALPIDKNMFLYIMGKAKAWGMTMYEQDWLYQYGAGLKLTSTNLTAAATWMRAMGDAAAELGVTMQLCLPQPAHIMMSSTMQAVTNSRASGDYNPGEHYSWDNWNIHKQSLFFHGLGLAPFKDDFWTSEVQPGSNYTYNATEPNWQMQAVIATLSTGGVSISDRVGATNVSLVMSTCRAGDGLLLKPDVPAVTLPSAWGSVFTSPRGWKGEWNVPNVSAAYSQHGVAAGTPVRWHYVLASDLLQPFTLRAADLGPGLAAPAYALFDFFAPAGGRVATLPVAGGGSFTIPLGTGQPSAPAKALPMRYYVAAPVLPGGWVLYGEVGKIVPMAHQRVSHFAAAPAGGFSATVHSSDAESQVTFLVQPPSSFASTHWQDEGTGSGAAAGAPVMTAVTCAVVGGADVTLACTSAAGCSCM